MMPSPTVSKREQEEAHARRKQEQTEVALLDFFGEPIDTKDDDKEIELTTINQETKKCTH